MHMDAAADTAEAEGIQKLLKKTIVKGKMLELRTSGLLFHRQDLAKRKTLIKIMELHKEFLLALCAEHPGALRSSMQEAVKNWLQNDVKLEEPAEGFGEFARQQAFALKQMMIFIRRLAANVKDGSRTPSALVGMVNAYKSSAAEEQAETPRALSRKRSSLDLGATGKREDFVEVTFLDRRTFQLVSTQKVSLTPRRVATPMRKLCLTSSPSTTAVISGSPSASTASSSKMPTSPIHAIMKDLESKDYYDEHRGCMARLHDDGSVEHAVDTVKGDAGFCVAVWQDGGKTPTEIPNASAPVKEEEKPKAMSKAQPVKPIGKAKAKAKAAAKAATGKVKGKAKAKAKAAAQAAKTAGSRRLTSKTSADLAGRQANFADESVPADASGKQDLKELESGWKIVTRYRVSGDQSGEAYHEYIDPQGVKYRSKRGAEIAGFTE